MIKKFLAFFGLLLLANSLFATNLATPTSNTKQLLRRIALLESALAPTNPQAVATAWAKAAKDRNGAVQYMLLCPNLQKANLANLEALNWVTGVSSPSISSYKIIPQEIKGNTKKFSTQYQFAAGGKETWNAIDQISIVPVNHEMDSSQQWCINQFNSLSPVDLLDAKESK